MSAHISFDNEAEEEKLAAIREKEQEDVTEILSSKYGIPYLDLTNTPINSDALRLIPEEKAREAKIIAFQRLGKNLSVALADPNNPALPRVFSELERRNFVLTKFLVSSFGFEKALARYEELSYAASTTAGVFGVSEDEFRDIANRLTSIDALRAKLTESYASKKPAQTSRVFEEIVAAALSMKASDIHFEPEEHTVRLRLRLDGMLTDAFDFDPKAYRFINSRVKLLSGLKLNIENRAQDGRFTIAIGETETEIRTSVIPGNYGESIVLRVLDPNTLGRSFEELGIHPKLLERLKKEIRRPNGMLLTTGPTGSGKTTTLYAFLKELHTPEVKIITIEDPIEYHLPGIVQTQTGKDYTFASGLRSVLRQDPDVILVGEVRDKEVAETAIQAALTGHFVFSTLHTNNAAGTFPRLVDLGADPKVFASSITVAMAQRLLRTLDETKKARPATEEEQKLISAVLETIEDKSLVPENTSTVYDPTPDASGGTGYKGRTGVYEAIFMDEELGEFLRSNPSEADVAKHVRRQGFLTMAQDGILKVLAGMTSLEELKRAVELPEV